MPMPTTETLERVYGSDAGRAAARLAVLEERYRDLFGAASLEFFSAPGRTEIIGNHTDHNGGKILAASIAMDTVGAAARVPGEIITIVSEGYDDPIVVDLSALEDVPCCQGSVSLVAGIAEAIRKRGFSVHGFNAVCSTEVIPSAGVSSSASFEMLVVEIMSHLFNEGAISLADHARIGQYAENVWWNKASGLMDQMACAAGGTIMLDFSDGVSCEKVDFGFSDLGCELVIVNTGRGHADLSAEYSAVPAEMRAVARSLGAESLSKTSLDALLDNFPRVRAEVGTDRAVLRAMHFFEECDRVDEAARALEAGDKERVLDLIRESGRSSWMLLQNAYVPSDPAEQPIPVALALTELFLRRVGAGVCRLHGGGFAGVIMCVVPREHADEYVSYMEGFLGDGSAYRTNIRQVGAVRLG